MEVGEPGNGRRVHVREYGELQQLQNPNQQVGTIKSPYKHVYGSDTTWAHT